ncbi:hypothetical protein ID853_16880 [Xenorhabdus sp. Vera]|nr:hypothetical protein [Xenorhabdus sp. Vera]MBD2812510.1 hypothetical protein [Xenorhabdus sp. Vera]
MTSQCKRVDDGRAIAFNDGLLDGLQTDLSNIKQRMPFVYKAAERFDEMLHNDKRSLIEESLNDIASGRGVE